MVCERSRQKFPFDVQHRSIIIYDTGSSSDFDTLKIKIVAKLKAIGETKPLDNAVSKNYQFDFQLYDRRVEVYDAVIDFAGKIAQNGRPTQGESEEYLSKIRQANFLFNAEVDKYCRDFYRNARNLTLSHGHTAVPGAEELVHTYRSLMIWFREQLLGGANEVFTPFLRIDN